LGVFSEHDVLSDFATSGYKTEKQNKPSLWNYNLRVQLADFKYKKYMHNHKTVPRYYSVQKN